MASKVDKTPCLGHSIVIRSPQNDQDLARAAILIAEYVSWLDIDLSFQNYEEEKATFPGQYAPPRGALAIAFDSVSPESRELGVVALRPLAEEGVCEMKRLWVTVPARGLRIADRLVTHIISSAEEMGYREIRLDTLPHMTAARALYRKFGFVEIEPYYENPHNGAVFMSKKLTPRLQA